MDDDKATNLIFGIESGLKEALCTLARCGYCSGVNLNEVLIQGCYGRNDVNSAWFVV